MALERDIPWQKKLLDLAQQSCRVLAKRQTWEATGEEIPEYQVAVKLVHFWMIFLQNMSGQMQPPARGYTKKRENTDNVIFHTGKLYDADTSGGYRRISQCESG